MESMKRGASIIECGKFRHVSWGPFGLSRLPKASWLEGLGLQFRQPNAPRYAI